MVAAQGRQPASPEESVAFGLVMVLIAIVMYLKRKPIIRFNAAVFLLFNRSKGSVRLARRNTSFTIYFLGFCGIASVVAGAVGLLR